MLPIVILPFKGLPSIFVTIKAPFLSICSIAILVFLIKEKTKLKSLEVKLLLLYLGFVLTASLAAHKPLLALSGASETAGRFEGFITLFFYAIIFIAARNHLLINRKNLFFYLSVQGIVAFYSILQFYGIDPLVHYLNFRKGCYSTIGNQNFFGSYVVTLLTLSCGLYIMDRRPQTLFLCVLFFGGLLACNTRGCWLAFLSVVILSLFLLSKKKYRTPFITLLGVFTLVVLTMNYTRENHIKGRAMSIENQISMKEEAGSGRVQIWKMTLKAIGENPILGTGPENLKEHFNRTNNEGFIAYQKRTGKTVDKAHSEILHIAAVSGIPAAIIFILFLTTLFWHKRRILFNFNSSTILAMCITVYFLQSLFNISIITVAPLFWVLLGVFSRAKTIKQSEFQSKKVISSPS
ncbi:O-antigen ligase family protein [Crocinitomicaceae bacterium]|nr:O-antigen ligase family protein [Crocinitomicaceae bacterium]